MQFSTTDAAVIRFSVQINADTVHGVCALQSSSCSRNSSEGLHSNNWVRLPALLAIHNISPHSNLFEMTRTHPELFYFAWVCDLFLMVGMSPCDNISIASASSSQHDHWFSSSWKVYSWSPHWRHPLCRLDTQTHLWSLVGMG